MNAAPTYSARPPEEGDDVTCKRCGATGLEWIDSGKRWRLIDERGRPHECGPVAKAENFEQ